MLANDPQGLSAATRDFSSMFNELRASRIAKAAGRSCLRANDGTERWVHCSAVCLDAGTAAVSRLVLFIEDKSEADQLERRMREADCIASLDTQRGAGLDELADNIAAIGGGIAYLRELADGMHFLGRGEPDGQTFAELTSTRAGTLPSAWWPQAERLLRCAVPTATRLHVRIDDSCPRIAMQSNVLMQSLVNLLVNARDAVVDRHGPPGRDGEIEIAFEPVGRGKDARVGVRVSDNGTSMNESTPARAHEPFYTTKPAGRGTGLGLAMVSSSVAQAAGLLSIESAVGVGTQITMLLPVAAS